MSTPKIQNSEEKKRVNREQWLATAYEAIAAGGLTIFKNTHPLKTFSDTCRFFIQKCTYPDGSKVIVKISPPNPADRLTVKKEAYWYQRIQELVSEAQKKGVAVSIRFPEVIDVFTHKNQTVLVMEYVANDWMGFKSLSQEEREDIIIKIIESMQKIPIPSEELAKVPEIRLLPVITGEDYPKRARKYLGELVAFGHISGSDKERIIALMEKNVTVISGFPMRLDHGDFHIGNFRYSKDSQTGEDIITLFDLELMAIQNSFSMVAAAANFFDLAAFAHVHPERDSYPEVLSDIPTFNMLFSAPQMIHRLEKRFVMNNQGRKDAELVYRLMRIDDCYVRLADAVYESQLLKQELNKVEVDSYIKIIKQQLSLLV